MVKTWRVYLSAWLRKQLAPRAKITKFGTVQGDRVSGWGFDAQGRMIAAIEILQDGSVLIAGWPLAELRKLGIRYGSIPNMVS